MAATAQVCEQVSRDALRRRSDIEVAVAELGSAGGRRQRLEPRQGRRQLCGPAPAGLEAKLRLPNPRRPTAREAQEPVVEAARAPEREGSPLSNRALVQGPGDEVVGDQDQLDQDGRRLQSCGKQLCNPRVLVVGGSGPSPSRGSGGGGRSLRCPSLPVGEDRLEAVAVVTGEEAGHPGWGRSQRTITLAALEVPAAPPFRSGSHQVRVRPIVSDSSATPRLQVCSRILPRATRSASSRSRSVAICSTKGWAVASEATRPRAAPVCAPRRGL